MKRRDLLGSVAGGLALGGAVLLAGDAQTFHRLRGPDSPATIFLQSDVRPISLTLEIERDGEFVFDGRVSIDENGDPTSTEGDEYRDAEFESAGVYTVTVDTPDRSETNTLELT